MEEGGMSWQVQGTAISSMLKHSTQRLAKAGWRGEVRRRGSPLQPCWGIGPQSEGSGELRGCVKDSDMIRPDQEMYPVTGLGRASCGRRTQGKYKR